jgi:hypothetical protein
MTVGMWNPKTSSDGGVTVVVVSSRGESVHESDGGGGQHPHWKACLCVCVYDGIVGIKRYSMIGVNQDYRIIVLLLEAFFTASGAFSDCSHVATGRESSKERERERERDR